MREYPSVFIMHLNSDRACETLPGLKAGDELKFGSLAP